MSKSQLTNKFQHNKTIRTLEAKIRVLNKAVAALPPLCDCETQYSHEKEYALAEKLAALWEKDFQEELRTGVRASMDDMDPSRAKADNE